MYSPSQIATLTRDCDAVLIPMGTPVFLREGEQVYITQALGGSFTVQVNGNLVRIDAKDADALGLSSDAALPETPGVILQKEAHGPVEEEALWEQLRTCYDPEIPVNIVELGLVYRCEVVAVSSTFNRVEIDMTLTAPGCGMGPILVSDVYGKIATVPNVTDVKVELVFDPPWDQSRMTEAARLQLGLL